MIISAGQADQYEVSASDLAAGVTRLPPVSLMQNEQAGGGGGGITVLGGQAQLNIHQMQHDLQEQAGVCPCAHHIHCATAGESPSQPPVNQPPVTIANMLPPVHIRPTTVTNAAINPPGMPNMSRPICLWSRLIIFVDLPPPGYAASGYALAPPPSFGQRMPLPPPQVGRAGFIGYTPHQPPAHFKDEDEASYSDTR
jgi:hypothetical protein